MKFITALIAILLCCPVTYAQTGTLPDTRQQAILHKYLDSGAYRYHYTLQGWSDHVDKGLEQDSTIALLWQMKALPYWKTGKYERALACYDKAVQYDRRSYLSRRGFLKCIFQKQYASALEDLETAEREFGRDYQNDHSCQFYIALCHLQLGHYKQAETVLKSEFDKTITARGETWIHFLELFYMGLIHYEQLDYTTAVQYLDKALVQYPRFSDARYYKGLCYLQQGDMSQAQTLMLAAKADSEKGYTINEDDSFYERYPYQVNWHMAKWTIPGYQE